MKSYFLDLAKRCQINMDDVRPFIFAHTQHEPSEIPDLKPDEFLAPPFAKFFIEMEEGYITVSPPEDTHRFSIMCVYCEELAPNVYNFAMLGEVVSTINLRQPLITSTWIMHDTDDRAVYNSLLKLVNTFITRIHTRVIGRVGTSGKLKYKDSENFVKTYKPNNILYVSKVIQNSGKRIRPDGLRTQCGQWIHYINLTSVMAHWRRLSNPLSMGLDRNGNRCIVGSTFIKQYTKGNGLVKRPQKIHKVTR